MESALLSEVNNFEQKALAERLEKEQIENSPLYILAKKQRFNHSSKKEIKDLDRPF
jgi:hypothetical protein